MHFKVNIFSDSLDKVINDLKQRNYQIIGTQLRKGIEINEFKVKDKYALIMGNEGRGVSEHYLNLCDAFTYIKMNNQCESLNVGVATSIILANFSHKKTA